MMLMWTKEVFTNSPTLGVQRRFDPDNSLLLLLFVGSELLVMWVSTLHQGLLAGFKDVWIDTKDTWISTKDIHDLSIKQKTLGYTEKTLRLTKKLLDLHNRYLD